MNMNPNDFMGYTQGQQPQQPMQMPNFNPSMPMQPNFGKGMPNFNPSNMPMNRPNAMNQFQAMPFQGMPNPMNQMPTGGMANPIAPPMNQNMMKQHSMMQPTGASFGFPAPNSRHRSSLTGMQFNNTQMFPQMMQTQSGSQPPTTVLPSQSTAQPKKKRSSTNAASINNTNNANNNTPSGGSNNANSTTSNTKNFQIAPSSSIDNISGSVNSNPNTTTPASSSITDSTPEKSGSSSSSRSGNTKSGNGKSNQQKHAIMSNQASLSGIGSIGSMNNLTAMNSLNNLNMGINNMNSMGNMGNLSGMGSINNMNSMNNMSGMNMNMNMGMNMGMPMGGMNMSGMNVMNSMNMMNSMNPMSSGIGLSGMSSMGNLSGMGSMNGMNNMNNMSSMNGMPGMGNIGTMGSMSGMPASSGSQGPTSSIPPTVPPPSSTSSSQPPPPQQPPNQPQQSTQQTQQAQSSQPQQQQQSQQQISVPPQIQAHMSSIPQLPMMVGISPDISRLTNILAKEIDEKAELFFSLFDIHQGKKREEKIDFFIKYAMKNFLPNWMSITLAFLEQIHQSPVISYSSQTTTPLSISLTQPNSNNSNNSNSLTATNASSGSVAPNVSLSINMFQKFREPALPTVFSRAKGCKPSYKNIVLNQNRLEYAPSKNCRKSPYIALGSIICANEKIDFTQNLVSVFCEKNEIQPLKFGENENYYLLFPEGGKIPSRFTVQIKSQSSTFPPSFLTWFVIQYVEKKSAADILLSLLSTAMPSTTQNEKIQIARTPMCKGCSFYAIHAIEDILNKGSALCPTCHANINLNDLIFDSKAAAPPQQIVIEENKEMHQGRISCADALTSLMKPSHTEQDWPSILFNQGGLVSKEYEPLEYKNTSEFRDDLSGFKCSTSNFT